MPEKTYYQHFRTDLLRPTTVAYRVEGSNVIYTKAVCGPKDQFCRKIGRDIATGRLNKGHEVDSVQPKDLTSHDEIRGLILNDLGAK